MALKPLSILDLSRILRIKASLLPINDVRSSDNSRAEWLVTGPDSQFKFKSRFLFPIPAGRYQLIAVGGANLDHLHTASLYVDTGAGFNEEQRQTISFAKVGQSYIAHSYFEAPVVDLRFDPVDGDHLGQFSLRAIEFRRVTKNKLGRASDGSKSGKKKLLINLFRLLPGASGAGGAGRLVTAFLAYLPGHVALRAIVSPAHMHLAAQFPDVEFFAVPIDNTANLSTHFDWCDCYFDPLNGLRPTFIPPEIPVLCCLLDLQHMQLPSLFSEAEFNARLCEYGYAANRADRLVAISNFEKVNLHTFYGIDSVSVMPLSGFMAEDIAEENDARQARLTELRKNSPRSEPYLIYPAVPWLHKNHEVLVQAIAILRDQGIEIPVVLTNTGSHKDNAARLRRLIKTFGLGHLIEMTDFLAEEELAALFCNSTGMVFPTLYEGFGIPLVDAMKMGVPILTSTTSAVTEICGTACEYFAHPRNALSVALDIKNFWSDDEARKRLVTAGYEQAANFSSRKMAADLYEAMGLVIEQKKEQTNKRGNLAIREALRPKRAGLSVFVVDDVAGDPFLALGDETALEDINSFFSERFGKSDVVNVTLGVPLKALRDSRRKIFSKAERLVCFEGDTADAIDFAVEDFYLRHADKAYSMVTRLSSLSAYDSDSVQSALMGLELYTSADYATFNKSLTDITLGTAPSDLDGVEEYNARRTTGYSVFDTIVRRSHRFAASPNGSVEFLSGFCARGVALRCPRRVQQNRRS